MAKGKKQRILLASFIFFFSLFILYFATYNYRLNIAKEKIAEYVKGDFNNHYSDSPVSKENIVLNKVFMGWTFDANRCKLTGASDACYADVCMPHYEYFINELNYSTSARKISDC